MLVAIYSDKMAISSKIDDFAWDGNSSLTTKARCIFISQQSNIEPMPIIILLL